MSKSAEKLDLPKYKTAPPYGGTLAEWSHFFLSPHYKIFGAFTALHIARKTFYNAQSFFVALLVGTLSAYMAGEGPASNIALCIGVYFGLNIIAALASFLIPINSSRADRLSKEINLFAFKHYLNLSESWHQNKSSGEKLQRVLSARESSFLFMDNYFWHVLDFPALLIGICLSVSLLSAPPYYILLLSLYVLSYIGLSLYTGNIYSKRFPPYYKSLENVVGKAYEFLQSTSTVRFFNLKNHVMDTAQRLEKTNLDDRRHVMNFNFFRWFILNTVAAFWITTIMAMSAYDFLHGNITIAAVTAVTFLCIEIWGSADTFALIHSRMIEYINSLKRLAEVLNTKPDIKDKPDAKALQCKSYGISFDNVTFEYAEDKTILNALSVSVKDGEKVGLLGPSGAGKSTLVKLLLRFYDPSGGVISIGGEDIRNVTRESLQDKIAVIPQDVTLFNHPLIENIRYGNLLASDEEVFEAAKKANAHEFIKDLPDGYNTLVGERGVKLSGGQRQRIAIARAILKNAPILILDEATSALDSESEMLIQQSLQELMKGKTVIAIAHRLSTISSLDRLIVMDQGTITEDGAHDELLEKGGLYARLWDMQSGGFLKE